MGNNGRFLHGMLATYGRIRQLKGAKGTFSTPYVGTVEHITKRSTARLQVKQDVLIKIPRLPPNLSYEDTFRFEEKLAGAFAREFPCLQRLDGLRCVAHVLDYGVLPPNDQGFDFPATFLVQDLIQGNTLDVELGPTFNGVRDAKAFFHFARQLSEALLAIHREQVVHGDIWYRNIMIDRAGHLVLIDFGQGVLRDLALSYFGRRLGTHTFLAPEGSGAVSGDIYATGATLYYIATGQHPPKPIVDDDELKATITTGIRAINPDLYDSNCGVIDVIARCMRHDPHARISNADGILNDIEMFSSSHAKRRVEYRDLPRLIKRLEQTKPLFARMADSHARELERELVDMDHSVFDLTGDHEQIVTGFTKFLSFLDRDDSYLTVSSPQFWHPENLGIKGRFLSMNIIAAQRRATIRRVFLVTEEDRRTLHFAEIIEAQLRAITQLKAEGIPTTDREVSAGGYWIGYKEVTEEERQHIVRDGKHAGLLYSGDDEGVLAAATYTKSNAIVAIRFRAIPRIVSVQRDYFNKLLLEASPLVEFVDQSNV